MDIPIDDIVGRVVVVSRKGVPNPWVTAVLSMGMGDLWVLDSRYIHQGGSPPTLSPEMPALLPLWP